MKTLTPSQQKHKHLISKNWKFKLYLLKSLPLGYFCGLRIINIGMDQCTTSIPFKWLTKNPFKSMYFAVQSMAAELSTAAPCLLAVSGEKPSVAFIIVDMKATFFKKATSKVFFTCEESNKAFVAVENSKTSGEPQSATFKTIGKMKDGTIVSEFDFTWSFKQRSL